MARFKAWGAGIEDGARHFVQHKRFSRAMNAANTTLRGDYSVLYKARVVAAVAAYVAKTASPIGLARNTYYSVKEGVKSYNGVREDEMADAIEAVVGPLDPYMQEILRNTLLNPAMPDDAPVVAGPWTAQRINKHFTDFEKG